MWPLRDIQQSCPFQVFALSPLRATQALFASKASLRRKSIPEVILLCFEQVIPAKIIWQPLFLALLEMITAIYPPTPPVVCRLPSDPTLLPYFLNWSIPGGPVTPCSDFWSFFLPSPGLLYFWGVFFLCSRGASTTHGCNLGLQNDTVGSLQHSRATGHAVWGNEWRETSRNCRRKGTVQFLW